MTRRVMLVVLATAALSGCAFLKDLLAVSAGTPAATLRSADVTDATLQSATLTLRYVVDNPGAVPLRVTAVDYAFTVDGRALSVPVPRAGAVIQPGSSLELAFPAKLTFGPEGDGSPEVARYDAQGTVSLSSATGPLQLPLSHQGALERPRRPLARFGLPRFGAGANGATTLELPLSLENPNAFALPLSLSGGLSVFGVRVAALTGSALGSLGARETREVVVPLSFDLPGAALTALQAAVLKPAPSAPLAFDGALESGTTRLPLEWSHALRLPSLAFAGTSFSDWSLEGVTLNVLLDADNPEAMPLSVGDLKTALTVNGKPAAALVTPPAPTLAANGKSRVTLPLRFQFADAAAGLVAVLQQRSATYALTGSIGLPTAFGVVPLPLKQQGQFALPQLPKIAFKAPRIANLSLTTASLEMPLEVTNPNAFELPVSAVNGAIALSGAKVGTIATGDLGMLPAGGTRTVSLPLTFELLEAAQAATALRSGSAPLAFDGALTTGQLSLPMRWAQTVAITR